MTMGIWSSSMAAEDGKPNPIVDKTSKTIGEVRADADMLEVLNAHAALNPRAIEKISVEEARKNPTIADAVISVLQKQGKSTKP